MCLISPESVAELQGYYGSFSLVEKVIQDLWNKTDFQTDQLKTTAGEFVEIEFPGVLNKLEGPDFKSATIKINGRKLQGDVEVHIYPGDWAAHKHAFDQNYQNVVLHVTLFETTKTIYHEPSNRLVLLPYLKEDLESILTRYLVGEAVLKKVIFDLWLQNFLDDKNGNRQGSLLFEKSKIRWAQKVEYAKYRLKKHGWMESCHQYLMEVLGYRRNRSVMHDLACQFPIMIDTEWNPLDLFNLKKHEWKLCGCRPANHPLYRLESYGKMLEHSTRWPMVLKDIGVKFINKTFLEGDSPDLSSMKSERIRMNVKAFLNEVLHDVCANQISGTRIHTLVCDAFLPLLSAELEYDFFYYWFYWYSGDCPHQFDRAIVASEIIKSGGVKCNGWNQGLLQLGFETA